MYVRVLGSVEVEVEGRPVPLPALRTRGLLAALALHANGVVAADRLLGLLWDGEARGRNRLQWQVSRLRRLLRDGERNGRAGTAEPERLAFRPPGYLLRLGPDELDLEAFRRLSDEGRRLLAEGDAGGAGGALRAALDLWRGPALQDVPLPALRDAGARLDGRRLAVLEDRVEADLAVGRHAELVGELEVLLAEHPLRERLCGQLMLALYRSGRQADALAVYRDARAALVEAQGLEPGPKLQRLEQAILARDPALDHAVDGAPATRAPAAASSPSPSPAAAPSMLPPDVADFTGREEHLRTVVAALAGNGSGTPAVAVSALSGRAGVGKTALAVHAAHHLRDRYPDGQLYVNLHGAGSSPADPAAVLGRFLRVLGLDPVTLPRGVEECAELYRSRLAGTRTLVVLDDAADEAQVVPLLPGSPSCAVLVTSRRRLTGLPGARRVALDVLDPGQAVELLARAAGRDRVEEEPAAALELARLCGWLPLALRIAASRLAAREHWTVSSLVERLVGERCRLDELTHGPLEVRSSLTLSYETLSPPARELFRRLGRLDAPDVAAWVGAALLDVPVREARELLDSLVDAHLLDVAARDRHEARYRFHDLVRLFARERAAAEEPPETLEAALARAFGAWLWLAEGASERIGNPFVVPVRGDTARWPLDEATSERLLADPLAWLEAERLSLLATIVQAARVGAVGIAWELTSTLTQFWAARHHLDDWRRSIDVALEATRAAGDRHGEAAVLLSLSDLRGFGHKEDLSVAAALPALDILTELGDRIGQAMVLTLLGCSRFFQGQLDEAVRLLDRALAAVGPDGCPRARASVLRTYGIVHFGNHQPKQAAACFEEALDLYRRLGSERGVAELGGRLGAALGAQGRHEEAVTMLRDAARVLEWHGDTMNLTVIRGRLAEALADLGRDEECLAVVELVVSGRDPMWRGRGLRVLARLQAAEGRHDDARASLDQALGLFRSIHLGADEAETLRMRADLDTRASAGVATGAEEAPER